jgi:hypothetical protein
MHWKIEIVALQARFFIFLSPAIRRGSFFCQKEILMQTTSIENYAGEDAKAALRRIAKIIYAETRASSLPAVEALASMIGNLCVRSSRPLAEIAEDKSIFESLGKNSSRRNDFLIAEDDPKFQICLRTARRMSGGRLPDSVRGATRFHREEQAPEWSDSLGAIAEVDGLMFYA